MQIPATTYLIFSPFFIIIIIIIKIRWVCKNHWKTNYRVPIPPTEEGDMLRSMSVVPYLDDLHNPTLDEEGPQEYSHIEESYSAG